MSQTEHHLNLGELKGATTKQCGLKSGLRAKGGLGTKSRLRGPHLVSAPYRRYLSLVEEVKL